VKMGVLDAFFQAVTARTAGFNTVPVGELSESSKLVLILLMFVGGSPGGTAGGVKTVTVVIILMAVIAMLRKRAEVEVLRRSIRNVIVDRAVTIVTLYVLVLLVATLALNVTESHYRQHFALIDMMFETASALGTVGLTVGITPTLTMAGKVIIIAVMLIGRLGPLTLVAALTFNTKPARYDYPDEAVIVG
jgi:trk system potassium uptake protein TrkH